MIRTRKGRRYHIINIMRLNGLSCVRGKATLKSFHLRACKMKKDKFQEGNLLYHVPTKSRWIVLERSELNYKQTSFWRLRVEAQCLYNPRIDLESGCGWRINEKTKFILQDKDLRPKDKIWKVLYEK